MEIPAYRTAILLFISRVHEIWQYGEVAQRISTSRYAFSKINCELGKLQLPLTSLYNLYIYVNVLQLTTVLDFQMVNTWYLPDNSPSETSRKHTYITLTPLNPTFI